MNHMCCRIIFTFCIFPCVQVPKLLSMHPIKGSRAGGTRVTIRGEHLDIGSEVQVKVNNTEECIITEWESLFDSGVFVTKTHISKISAIKAFSIEEHSVGTMAFSTCRHHKICGFVMFTPFSRKTEETIECIMPPALQAQTDSVLVCVEFENILCQNEKLSTTYTYEKNPTISFIHPKKSYLRYWDTYEYTKACQPGWVCSSTITVLSNCNAVLMCSFLILLPIVCLNSTACVWQSSGMSLMTCVWTFSTLRLFCIIIRFHLFQSICTSVCKCHILVLDEIWRSVSVLVSQWWQDHHRHRPGVWSGAERHYAGAGNWKISK